MTGRVSDKCSLPARSWSEKFIYVYGAGLLQGEMAQILHGARGDACWDTYWDTYWDTCWDACWDTRFMIDITCWDTCFMICAIWSFLLPVLIRVCVPAPAPSSGVLAGLESQGWGSQGAAVA